VQTHDENAKKGAKEQPLEMQCTEHKSQQEVPRMHREIE